MRTRRISPIASALAGLSLLLLTTACGGNEPAAPAASPAVTPTTPPSAGANAPAAAGSVTIIEPAEGSSSGHISLFRWNPVEGATGYKVRLVASTDGRTVWDSPVIGETEADLPNTIALEPEGYLWTVTAMKGDSVIATSPQSRFTVTP